jgi:hypothetical protein
LFSHVDQTLTSEAYPDAALASRHVRSDQGKSHFKRKGVSLRGQSRALAGAKQLPGNEPRLERTRFLSIAGTLAVSATQARTFPPKSSYPLIIPGVSPDHRENRNERRETRSAP